MVLRVWCYTKSHIIPNTVVACSMVAGDKTRNGVSARNSLVLKLRNVMFLPVDIQHPAHCMSVLIHLRRDTRSVTTNLRHRYYKYIHRNVVEKVDNAMPGVPEYQIASAFRNLCRNQTTNLPVCAVQCYQQQEVQGIYIPYGIPRVELDLVPRRRTKSLVSSSTLFRRCHTPSPTKRSWVIIGTEWQPHQRCRRRLVDRRNH